MVVFYILKDICFQLLYKYVLHSQISISLFPDQSFQNLYVLSYFGECSDIDDAEKYDYVKHIHTEAENIYLSKYRKTTMTEERF